MVSSTSIGAPAGYVPGLSSCMYTSTSSSLPAAATYPDTSQYYGNVQGPVLHVTAGGNGKGTPSKAKNRSSSYKHIPHRDKPPHLVQRRNARERRRVQAVNTAFSRLRRHIPHENRNKRLSKVKTLKIAMDYIEHMRDLITNYDSKMLIHQQQQQQHPHQQQHHHPDNNNKHDKWTHSPPTATYVDISPQQGSRENFYGSMFGATM